MCDGKLRAGGHGWSDPRRYSAVEIRRAMSCCCATEEPVVVEFATPVAQSTLEEHSPCGSRPSSPSAMDDVLRDEPDLAWVPRAGAAAGVEETAFEADIDRASGALGLYLDLSDGLSLYVCRVAEDSLTPTQRYNRAVPPERRLMAGDYILEVNGVSGSAAKLVQQIKMSSRLKIKVYRAVTLRHLVRKQGQNMGLDLQFAKKSSVLCISQILDGAVKSSGMDIQHGDRIVRVNGKEGTSEQLLEELKISNNPDVTVSRCAPVLQAYDKGFRPEQKPEVNPEL